MTRHREATAARYHIRCSDDVKRRLLELKSSRFSTIDKVLRHYLFSDTVAADKRPVFVTHKELYDLTKHEPINSIIIDAAKRITQQSRDKAKSVPVYSNKKRKRW